MGRRPFLIPPPTNHRELDNPRGKGKIPTVLGPGLEKDVKTMRWGELGWIEVLPVR